jgi:hypothetical protein
LANNVVALGFEPRLKSWQLRITAPIIEWAGAWKRNFVARPVREAKTYTLIGACEDPRLKERGLELNESANENRQEATKPAKADFHPASIEK